MTETPHREVLTYLIECAERDIKLGEQMGVSDGALRIAKLTYYGLCELGRLQAQRCETCGEWMTVGGPDECPWMFGICPERGYCFHWKSREEPQPCP